MRMLITMWMPMSRMPMQVPMWRPMWMPMRRLAEVTERREPVEQTTVSEQQSQLEKTPARKTWNASWQPFLFLPATSSVPAEFQSTTGH